MRITLATFAALIPTLILSILASLLPACASHPPAPAAQTTQPAPVAATDPMAALHGYGGDPAALKKLYDEVTSADGKVRSSLPELKYATRHISPWGARITTLSIRSVEGKEYQIVIVSSSTGTEPSGEFMLAYLRSPKGVLVDWKSQSSSSSWGNPGVLRPAILDLNQSGVQDFCFVKGSSPLLAAWCVRDGAFLPAIAERKSYFDIKFDEATSDEGVVVRPQLERVFNWETDKFYEIPIKIINRSAKAVDLRARYATVAPDFDGICYCDPPVGSIPAGGTVETTMTVMFPLSGWRQRSCRFGFSTAP